LEDAVGGDGECGDEVEALLVRGIRSLDILSLKKFASATENNVSEEEGIGLMVAKIVTL